MPGTRKVGLILSLLGAVGFVSSGYCMARRVAAYYVAQPPPKHLFVQFTGREFPAFGRQTRLLDDHTPEGAPALRIEYGDRSLLLPVHAPAASNRPDLAPYEQWVAALASAPMTAGQVNVNLADPAGQARLAIVSRNAAPGFADDPGGLVARAQWTFDIVELKPDGNITQRRLQFRNRRGELPALQADPAAQVEPMEERSWEWQAALFVIPNLQISNYRYKTDAVGGDADHPGMGWTLPAAGFSTLILTGGLALTASASVRRRDSAS